MNYDRKLLVGSWYGAKVDAENFTETEYAEIAIDGSYEFHFTKHNAQGILVEQSFELGDWGLVGDIHFTIAKSELIDEQQFSVDFADPNTYQAYKVIELNNQIFKYQHIVSQEVFILRRVIDKIAHC